MLIMIAIVFFCITTNMIKGGRVLYDVVEMTRTMHNSVNFYGSAMDHIEHKVGFNDENAISILRKFIMFGHPTKMRVDRESANQLVKLYRESGRPGRAITCDPVIDREQVVHSNRKVADRVLI